MGWRVTFWAIALLCVPATIGILRGVVSTPRQTAADINSPRLRVELKQLSSPKLILAMALGALVNSGTFAAFIFLAPIVTDTTGLSDGWVPIVLMMFGVGSFLGVTVTGRLSDRRPGLVLAIGGPSLLAGWLALALFASYPILLVVLVLIQGALSFGVGSTLITQVLYAASGAPTMGGSYATVALNIGAATGPVLGALGLATGSGTVAPLWVASGLTAISLVTMLLAGCVLTPTIAERGWLRSL